MRRTDLYSVTLEYIKTKSMRNSAQSGLNYVNSDTR